jgi:hypothetical protein
MGHFPDFICRMKPMVYAKKVMLRVLTSFRAAEIRLSLARVRGAARRSSENRADVRVKRRQPGRH